LGGKARKARREAKQSRWLFDPELLSLRPTGLARLRAVAARPQPAPTELEQRSAEDRKTIRTLRQQGIDLARRFKLDYKTLEAERDGVNEHYGICYEDGLIRIRLRHATTGRPLKESSLVDTLCHELAHLRHFNHGERFKRLYLRILNEARRLGYYRPGPVDKRPLQRSLFDDGRCGI
jgi:hypothetical protein